MENVEKMCEQTENFRRVINHKKYQIEMVEIKC